MRNFKRKLIELLGEEKGMKMYWHFYNHSIYTARNVVSVTVKNRGDKRFLCIVADYGEIWEIEL